MTQPDPKNRDYVPPKVLKPPKGCKDLSGAVAAGAARQGEEAAKEPEIHAWVFLPEKVAIRYLAQLIGQDVRATIGYMRQLGISCTINRSVDFADAQRLLLMYGIQAEPTEPEPGCSSERAD